MNFGLLCDDPAAGSLISVLRQHAEHRLTRAVLVSPRADKLLHGLGGVQCTDRWEDLLISDNINAVIVGGAASSIWDGAKRLASEGMPLLVFPTVADGAATLYELSLIRDDRQGILLPAWLHRFDSDLDHYRQQILSGESTTVNYLQWERVIAHGTGAEVPQTLIDEILLRDADVWQFLFGRADHVTALRTGATPTGAILQSVVLAGRGVPELTWTITSGAHDVCRLTAQTRHGPKCLDWSCSRLSDPGGEANARRLLDAFVGAVQGQTAKTNWNDVLQAAEIVDAAHRSLERRRTIELHHETLSERAIFKTQMAALGCGVLMLTLALMLGYLTVASLVPIDPRVLKWLRLAIFAPLFAFLLMQLLLPLTRTSSTSP